MKMCGVGDSDIKWESLRIAVAFRRVRAEFLFFMHYPIIY